MKLLAIVIASLMLLACGGTDSGSANSSGASPPAFDPPPTPGR